MQAWILVTLDGLIGDISLSLLCLYIYAFIYMAAFLYIYMVAFFYIYGGFYIYIYIFEKCSKNFTGLWQQHNID